MSSNPYDTTQRTLLSPGPLRPKQRSACVVVIHGEGLGRRADIEDAPVLVGRSQEADLVIAHKSVSREHCRIWREDGGYRIPRGTTVLVSQWVVHRDGRFFDEPLTFRPDRWADGLAARKPSGGGET